MNTAKIRTAFIKFFVSLRLTVVLLALSIVLVFWATLAQVQLGIWGVQEQFFRTFFVLLKIPGTEIPVPVFPGGYFLGGLLLAKHSLVFLELLRLQAEHQVVEHLVLVLCQVLHPLDHSKDELNLFVAVVLDQITL